MAQTWNVVTVTLTTDAESIGDNKVIAQSIEIPNFFTANSGRSLIQSIVLLDETTTGPAIDLLFSTTDDAITQDEGKAIGEDIADLDAVFANFVGHVNIVAGDWTDMFDAKLATKSSIGLVVHGPSDSTSLYCHAVNRSGSNWTAAATTNLKMKIGVQKY
ncbi:MAG: hypothetical protein QF535_12175 [Anaerolineales bacterium]|jgi:hypothetical protein|nr:hypothetical protein [Anaerolineales bacterium]|tara:strand:+ start:14781 stop:15260 length:480 start_codon:yes stop_codon:yes gene_type:complete